MGAPQVKHEAVYEKYSTPDGDDLLGGGCTYLAPSGTLVLDTTLVGDMGDPTVITVTIVPGDTLND